MFDQYVIETLSGSSLVERHLDPVEGDQIMVVVPHLQNDGATI